MTFDEELEAEALAADPDVVVADDAVSLWELAPDEPDRVRLLPEWYSAAPMTRRTPLTGWRRRMALLIVISFITIDAYGLCSTYGQIVFA